MQISFPFPYQFPTTSVKREILTGGTQSLWEGHNIPPQTGPHCLGLEPYNAGPSKRERCALQALRFFSPGPNWENNTQTERYSRLSSMWPIRTWFPCFPCASIVIWLDFFWCATKSCSKGFLRDYGKCRKSTQGRSKEAKEHLSLSWQLRCLSVIGCPALMRLALD